MQAGTTFRDEHVPLTYDTEEEALQECLKAYVKKSCEINEVPPYLFDEWMTKLKQAIKDKCRQMEYRHENEDKERMKRIADSLVRVQQEYVVLTADKASNTYVIHCKHTSVLTSSYQDTIRRYIQTSRRTSGRADQERSGIPDS